MPDKAISEREALRAEFENLIEGILGGQASAREPDGSYREGEAETAWTVWQAAYRACTVAQAVAWRWRTSDHFPDMTLTSDPRKAARARRHGLQVDALGVLPEISKTAQPTKDPA